MKITTALGTLILISSAAFAGPSSGGGGYAVSCPSSPVEAANIQLLDLYEIPALQYNAGVVASTGNLKADYMASVKRIYTIQGYPDLADQIAEFVERNLKIFFRITRFVNSAAELPYAGDVGVKPWIPTNCSLIQVAYFDDASQTATILKSAWDLMSSVDQAALVQHEIFYKHYRQMKDTDSVNSRRFVSMAFSNYTTPLKEGVPGDAPHLSSVGEGDPRSISSFYKVDITASGLTRLQFTHVHGRPALTKTWADIPLVNWNVKFARSKVDPNFVGCVAQDESVDQEVTTNLSGSQFSGLQLQVIYKTQLPVVFRLMKDGKVVSEETLSSCN